MKNLAKIFMAVVLLAGITSCVQDTTVDEGFFQPTTEITISVEDANRTALGAKTDEGTYPVYWSNGDKVSINGIESSALAVEGESQLVKGLFEFTGDLVAPYKASYPATAAAGQVLFAAKQSYKEGTFSEGAAAMYGESETLTIQMQHAAGVLQFPIKAAEGAEVVLSHAVVTNLNGSLAGTYNASLVEGELVLTAAEGATSNITYDCGGLELSTEPVKLHIAVPAGEYEELKVSLVATNGQVMNFKVTAVGEKKVKAGVVREFNKVNGITFSGNESSFAITDSESLMEFAQLCAEGGFAYGKAKVMNDFTFDSATYTWVPVEGFDFGAEFDGNDCTITGLTDALFGTAKANIHNLTLNSTIERAAVESNGIGLFACLFEGSVVDCTAKGSLTVTGSGDSGHNGHGGVIGECVGSISFVNVVNEAAVTIDGVNNTRNGVGGILGGTQGKGTPVAGVTLSFTNCHNKADLTSTVNGDKKRRNMGGLLGYSEGEHTITITSCSNSGDILNNTVIEDMHLGGIIGTNMCPMTTITDSYNTGNITCAGVQEATGNNYSMGGLVGYQTGSAEIKDCVNGGVINADKSVTKLATPNLITIGTAPGGTALGGMVGYFSSTYADYTYSVSGCKNYGTVKTVGASGKDNNGYETRAAGIIGYINVAGNITVSKCHNYGIIENDAENNPEHSAKGDCGGIVCRAVADMTGKILITECVNEEDAQIVFRGSRKNEVNHGGIMGCSGGADTTIEKCQNYGTIVSYGVMNSAMSLGGILGNISSVGTTVDNCTNYGKVWQADGEGNRVLVGGIVGYSYSSGILKNCINNEVAIIEISDKTDGSITSSSYTAIGGIVGYARGTAANTGLVSNCTNDADLTFAGYSQTDYYAGGVAGIIEMPSEKLYNNATLEFNGTATSSYYIGGVAGKVGGENVSILKNIGDITLKGKLLTGKSGQKAIYAPTSKVSGTPSLGGVVGLMTADALCAADSLVNTANITFAWGASANKSDNWANGGVIGLANNYSVSKAHFTKNTSGVAPKISFTSASPLVYNSGNNALFVAAGVMGCAKATVAGVEIKQCRNEGAIYVNSTANNNTHNSNFGGIIAKDDLGANGTIAYCVNDGTWTSGTNHKSANKSMTYGAIVGSGSCTNISHCTNNGSVLFESITNYSASTSYWYSANMGGIAGTGGQAMTISECTDNGSYTAEANSLTGTAPGRITTMGLVGSGTPKLVKCTANQTIDVNANCGAHKAAASATSYFKQSLYVAGLIGRLGVSSNTTGTTSNWTLTSLACIADECTITAELSAPGFDNVAMFTACTYAEATSCYTPAGETYPIMNSKIDGSIVKNALEIQDMQTSDFFKCIYKDTPTVESWVPVVGDDGVTRYHGNYGVNTEGGNVGDDL